MAMEDDASKREWIRRVLGVSVSTPTATPGPRAKLLPIWIDAKEEVDAGIAKLQNALRATGDQDLEQIAKFGLYGATEGESVQLMVALREADSGQADALKKVVAAVHDYQAFLDGAVIVDLIEDNPFGVEVPLRKRLGAALSELEQLATA
jgi:hypothetical protein